MICCEYGGRIGKLFCRSVSVTTSSIEWTSSLVFLALKSEIIKIVLCSKRILFMYLILNYYLASDHSADKCKKFESPGLWKHNFFRGLLLFFKNAEIFSEEKVE